jgi:hypothetical protein
MSQAELGHSGISFQLCLKLLDAFSGYGLSHHKLLTPCHMTDLHPLPGVPQVYALPELYPHIYDAFLQFAMEILTPNGYAADLQQVSNPG